MSDTLSLSSGDQRSSSPLPWSLGRTPSSYVVSNVRVVLDNRVADPASVVVERVSSSRSSSGSTRSSGTPTVAACC